MNKMSEDEDNRKKRLRREELLAQDTDEDEPESGVNLKKARFARRKVTKMSDASSLKSAPLSVPSVLPPPEQMLTQVVRYAVDEDAATRAGLEKILERHQTHYCDFDYLHTLDTLNKTSASASDVFFAKLNDSAVSIKVAYKTLNAKLAKDNSLPIERVNYRLMNNLLVNHWSPHVIAYVGSFGCSTETAMKKLPRNIADHINETLPTEAQLKNKIAKLKRTQNLDTQDLEVYEDLLANSQFDRVKRNSLITEIAELKRKQNLDKRKLEEYEDLLTKLPLFDRKNIDFLITERAQTKTMLYDWLQENHSYDENMNVIFQLLYTFEVFNRIGFRHNDAHTSNIFVEEHSQPQTFDYNVDGVNFTLKTKYFVKIFDFDKSAFNCDPKNINPAYYDLIVNYQQFLKDAGLPQFGPDGCQNTVIRPDGGLCDHVGQCNGINKKYDTFMTLSMIQYQMEVRKNTRVANFIHKHINGATKHAFEHSYLVTFDANGDRVSDYVPTDDEMSPTIDILLDQQGFGQFKALPEPLSHPQYKLPLPLKPRTPKVPILEPAKSWWSSWW